MKNLRLLICALLGVASAILSFSASAALVTLYGYSSMPISGSSYFSTSPPSCLTPPAQASYTFQDAGCQWSGNSYLHTGKWCYTSNQSICPNNYYRQDGTRIPVQCEQGMSLELKNGSFVCVNPCADRGGQTFERSGYAGDADGGVSGGDIGLPEYICNGQCRAVATGGATCYTRAYLSTSPKFGKLAVFCTQGYITMPQICVANDDPNNPPPANSPTDPADPATPLPSNPPQSPPGSDPGSPSAQDGAPTGAPTDCPPGTYAAKSGSGWICNGIDAPVPKPDDQGCPAGTTAGSYGVGEGKIVCVKSGNGQPGTNSPGSGTPGASGADGSGTKGGTNSTAGQPGSTADTGGPVGSGSGSSAGVGSATSSVDCGTPPVCTGDAVLCGIQQQEWQSACDLQKAIASPLPDEELEKWNAVGTEVTDSPEIEGSIGRVDDKLTDFSRRLSFSSGGCPGDTHINVMGRSITIAIGAACPLLAVMKMLIFLGAYLFSIRILWSAVFI